MTLNQAYELGYYIAEYEQVIRQSEQVTKLAMEFWHDEIMKICAVAKKRQIHQPVTGKENFHINNEI